MSDARRTWLLALFAILLVLPGLIFVGARLTLPSDGTQIVMESAPEDTGGLEIIVIADEGELRNGDQIIALEDRPLDAWLSDAMRGTTIAPAPSGSSLRYTVLREGVEVPIDVVLSAYPVGRALADNWTTYLFIGYLELVSLIVVIRRPQLPAARQFFILSSAILGSSLAFFPGLQISDLQHPWMIALWMWCSIPLFVYLASALLHFALIFPRRWPYIERRSMLLAIYVGIWIPYLILLVSQWADATITQRFVLLALSTAIITIIAWTLTLVASSVAYLRTTNPVEKRRFRWILWGIFIGMVPWMVLNVAPTLLGTGSQVAARITGLLWCAIPTAFAISILRENLFDIDVIIRRTLIYSTLTAILAGVYFGGVTLLQSLFSAVIGGDSTLAVVISTLAIAALFRPVRARVQRFIDRRFYRQKVDAERILAAFAEAVRDEIDVADIEAELIRAVNETMQPESVGLWVREGERISASDS